MNKSLLPFNANKLRELVGKRINVGRFDQALHDYSYRRLCRVANGISCAPSESNAPTIDLRSQNIRTRSFVVVACRQSE